MTLEEKAQKWLRDNDWDYEKYKDRRPNRSAYSTLMNYEITDLLMWAYEDVYKQALSDVVEILAEWESAYPEDIFTPPESYETVSKETAAIGTRYSGAMGRHMAKRVAEQIRKLGDVG